MEIAELTSFLDTKQSNTKPVPGTHHVHCVKSHGSDRVQVSDTTDGGEARVCVIRTTTTTQEDQGEQEEQEDEDEEEEGEEDEQEEEVDVQVGQWVAVQYDGVQYPGEVISIDTNGVQVNVMHKSGSCWKWPQSRDMISYEKSDILRIISVPVAAGHRGQFTFSDFWHEFM